MRKICGILSFVQMCSPVTHFLQRTLILHWAGGMRQLPMVLNELALDPHNQNNVAHCI